MTTTMPMFPLGSPLLPGLGLPLQVFEPRYHAMLDEVMAGDRRFGVTLITRGHEVGGGDIRSSVGATAEVLRHQEVEDGRVLVLAVGRERIRVQRWLRDDPYPLAEVEPWPDEPRSDDEGQPERAGAAGERTRASAETAADPDEGDEPRSRGTARVGRIDVQARLDDIVALWAGEVDEDRRGHLIEASTLPRDVDAAIWQATVVADLGPLDRQRLLEAPSIDQRLPLVVRLLEERRAVLAFTLAERA